MMEEDGAIRGTPREIGMKILVAPVLAFAAVLRVWGLTRNGVGTEYYGGSMIA